MKTEQKWSNKEGWTDLQEIYQNVNSDILGSKLAKQYHDVFPVVYSGYFSGGITSSVYMTAMPGYGMSGTPLRIIPPLHTYPPYAVTAGSYTMPSSTISFVGIAASPIISGGGGIMPIITPTMVSVGNGTNAELSKNVVVNLLQGTNKLPTN